MWKTSTRLFSILFSDRIPSVHPIGSISINGLLLVSVRPILLQQNTTIRYTLLLTAWRCYAINYPVFPSFSPLWLTGEQELCQHDQHTEHHHEQHGTWFLADRGRSYPRLWQRRLHYGWFFIPDEEHVPQPAELRHGADGGRGDTSRLCTAVRERTLCRHRKSVWTSTDLGHEGGCLNGGNLSHGDSHKR